MGSKVIERIANQFINCTNTVLSLLCGQSVLYFPECINALEENTSFL